MSPKFTLCVTHLLALQDVPPQASPSSVGGGMAVVAMLYVFMCVQAASTLAHGRRSHVDAERCRIVFYTSIRMRGRSSCLP